MRKVIRGTMRSVLCLDIGSGTQDALLHYPDREPENCPKFVLPSPAVRVAQRIRDLTEAGQPIYLLGENMGGGFKGAVCNHLDAGLPMAAHPKAALALHDDPARVQGMEISITPACPQGHTPVHLADFNPEFWHAFLALAGLDYPDLVLAAAQDHGFHPHGSNRIGRFELWNDFLEQAEGRPESLLFQESPEPLTRLATLQRLTGGPVADTGAAAALGLLHDPEVHTASHNHGVTLVNVGNSHVVAFLLFQGRILGVYEHHTGKLDPDKLWSHLERFRKGTLPGQEILEDNGHGCLTLSLPEEAEGFTPTYVTGPKRERLRGRPAEFPAPGGDMMLTGCFGLLEGWKRMHKNQSSQG